MPQYLTRKDNTFYFRQAVPAELRAFIGKREIKKSLGRDFVRAVSECKRYAVVADQLITQARCKLDSIPVDPYSKAGIRRTRHIPLTEVTPQLELEFTNFMRESLLETDRQTRIAGMNAIEFEEYGQHIEEALTLLRRQLARGQVEPMLEASRATLIGRGYAPDFSQEDWRRIAYAMTQGSLEAYEGMAARQSGVVVKANEAPILVSQFEVQNAAKNEQAVTTTAVTWQALYDVWIQECARPINTHAAYRAAMQLFNQFSGHKPPTAITREDVLAYRDLLSNENALAAGTVANKIGFVGTLINSGRIHASYAGTLPFNPFEGIKIKQSKKGKADSRRLPFSDRCAVGRNGNSR